MLTEMPTKAIMVAEDLSIFHARMIAFDAARLARRYAPKLTIASSSSFAPIWAAGFFGVSWEHPYVWYQEAGIRPFTMRNLAGKTIPMWLNDLDGKLARKYPKNKTRTTDSGRKQVLVFRRAAKIGATKTKFSVDANGLVTRRKVPASYPGAPGRIAVNRSQGILRAGDIDKTARNPGQIAAGNVGVRWRHPGLRPGRFIGRGLEEAAVAHGLLVADVQYLTRWDTTAQSQRSVLVHTG